MIRFLLRRARAARATATPLDNARASTAPFAMPMRYPPVDPGLPVVPLAEVLASQRDMVSRLEQACRLDPASTQAHVHAPIEAVARRVHLLPASAQAHFAAPGGLLRCALEVAWQSRQAAAARRWGPRESADARRIEEPLWRHVCFLAGLTHALDRSLSGLVVTDEAGTVWPQAAGPLLDWLVAQRADRYHVSWWGDFPAGPPRQEVPGVAGGGVLSAATLAWLHGVSPRLVAALDEGHCGGVRGPEADVLAIVQAARARVLSADQATQARRYGTVVLGHHLELHILDAIRHRVASGRWVCGRSPLWRGLDGLFLEWPAAADALREDFARQRLQGVPRCAFTLAEVLGRVGAVVPSSPGSWLWRLDAAACGHAPAGPEVARAALKFADPAAVLGYVHADPWPQVLGHAPDEGGNHVPRPVAVVATVARPGEAAGVTTAASCGSGGPAGAAPQPQGDHLPPAQPSRSASRAASATHRAGVPVEARTAADDLRAAPPSSLYTAGAAKASGARVSANGVPPCLPETASIPLSDDEVRMFAAWRACARAQRADLLAWLPGRGLAVSQDLLALTGASLGAVATQLHRRRWLGQGDWPSPDARAGPLRFDGVVKPGIVLNTAGLCQLGWDGASP